MSLRGKIAIITGGGTGIGLGIAEVLAQKGVKLVLVQRRLEPLQRAATLLPSDEVLVQQLDIRDSKAVEQGVEIAVRHFGGIDILVNNASITGMSAISPFLESDSTIVDAVVDTNLKGTFYFSQAVAKRMVAAGRGGNIVHISSVGAYAAQEFASLYCATKAAQVSLAQTMSLELARYRIRVNSIAAGDINTEASMKIVAEKSEVGASSRYVRATPLGHRGSPHDIGHAVAFLVSDEASFVTGTTLLVDGGFLSY
ncbi:MAG TPA: SDR family oxidoreductase [Terriglobales bacterium]|nr:SDR family oxidoreductase [Terriglobales bacterium]